MNVKSIKIYKGQSFMNSRINQINSNKIITFDLDETLGSFGDLYLLWYALEPFMKSYDESLIFRELLNIYPEFLRPGILPILEFLYNKKKIGKCSRVLIYTNNQCPTHWVQRILHYFEEKTPNLFDQVVCAFKIGQQRIEPLRTTNSKTYSDLIRCTLLPKNSEICFVDNSYHSKMVNERVYYIQPRSYEHGLSRDDIIQRFMTQWEIFPITSSIELILYKIYENHKEIHKTNTDALMVSHKIMYHLKEYFLLSTKVPKTKKIGWNLGRFTRKKK